MEHGDERRKDLHAELEVRPQRGHIVHHAQHDDDRRAEQNTLHLVIDLDEQEHTHDKAKEDGKAAKARHRFFVHPAVVLRHVDRADLVGEGFDHRAHQEADDEGAQQRRAHAQQQLFRDLIHSLSPFHRATKPTFL